MKTCHIGLEPVVVDAGRSPHRSRGPAQTRTGSNGQMMGGFRIEPERQRTNELRIDHARIIHTQASRAPPAALDCFACAGNGS